MNYFQTYANLVTRAKHRPSDFQGHDHHIVPKSIAPDLRDESWNMSQLTSREHLIAHLLLTKVIDKSEPLYTKIANALCGMVNHPQTSRHAKPWLKKYAHALYSKYNPNLGKPMSDAHKQALLKAHKGRPMPKHVKEILLKAHKGKSQPEAQKLRKTITKIESSLTNARGWDKMGNKYRVLVQQYGKQTHLGMFNTPEEAREAYVKDRLEHLAQLQCSLYGALGGI